MSLHRHVSSLVAACVVVALAAVASAPPASAFPVPVGSLDRAGSVIFRDDFDTWVDPAVWAVMDDTSRVDPAGRSQAQFVPDNVSVVDGRLAISARRHCLPPGEVRASPLNVDPRPEAECRAGGGTPAYSAGRLALGEMIPRGLDFELRISAQMPQNGVDGSRFALWAKNMGEGSTYCDEVGGWSDVGEIDLLEYSPGRRNDVVPPEVGGAIRSEQTTHLGCRPGDEGQPWRTQQSSWLAGFERDDWLEWVVTRVGNDISYALSDGVTTYPVGTHTCGVQFAYSQEQCDAILEQQWQVFLQSEVLGSGIEGYHPPDPAAPFADQTLLVDWIKITRL